MEIKRKSGLVTFVTTRRVTTHGVVDHTLESMVHPVGGVIRYLANNISLFHGYRHVSDLFVIFDITSKTTKLVDDFQESLVFAIPMLDKKRVFPVE